MGSRTIVMIAMAVIFAVLAVFAGRAWIDRQASERLSQIRAAPEPVATRKLVVAALPLRFGTEIGPEHVREIDWPAASLPEGGFEAVADLLNTEKPRTVLTPLEANEPVLASKLTGPGERATLSAVIGEGMKAVTVRANDVHGVAGFVLPGDRVDVLLTRHPSKGDAYSDLILQNLKVLAVDQIADDRTDQPMVAKAVTLEVASDQAQQLTLAASVGTLSLALRASGEIAKVPASRVSASALGQILAVATHEPEPEKVQQKEAAPEKRPTRTINVMRAAERVEYTVPAVLAR